MINQRNLNGKWRSILTHGLRSHLRFQSVLMDTFPVRDWSRNGWRLSIAIFPGDSRLSSNLWAVGGWMAPYAQPRDAPQG